MSAGKMLGPIAGRATVAPAQEPGASLHPLPGFVQLVAGGKTRQLCEQSNFKSSKRQYREKKHPSRPGRYFNSPVQG